MSANRLEYGGQALIVVEGVVEQIREWQESHVGTRTHVGGGWSIGTDTSYHTELWLRLDDGQEIKVSGGGGMNLRQGHRMRIGGPGNTAGLRAVALYNLTTGVSQYYEAEARDVWQAAWWWSLVALVYGLVQLLTGIVGLVAWGLTAHFLGIFYLTPAALAGTAAYQVAKRRRDGLRAVLSSAMGLKN